MQPAARHDSERGRSAKRPVQIPKSGWRDILLRTKHEISDDHVGLIAASIAFYALLALFPAIAALVALGGLALDPHQIEAQIGSFSGMLPQEAAAIIIDQARKVADNAGGGVTFAAIGGLLFTLYSASKAMKALIEGLNIIYEEREQRGFLRLNLTALGLTLAMILVIVVALIVITVVPLVLTALGLGSAVETLLNLARWPMLFVVAMLALAILYRYAPSRDRPRWKWVSWGAVSATLVWVAASIAFSLYVQNFGRYNETYGSLGAVIVMLMWFWISAFVVLLGAEVNSEMEHQTARDTTQGDPEPLGERGAHVADTVGKSP
jgi:membrane protein